MSESCNQCSGSNTAPDNSVESDCYATIEQDRDCTPSAIDLVGTAEESCVPTSITISTEGGDASDFTDARETASMTLLGRIGKKLAQFVGSGYIQVEDGEAKLVSFIPLRIKELFHRWVIPAPGQKPVLGESKPAPYTVIADSTGKCYAVKGLAGEDAVWVWSYEQQAWITKPLTDFPLVTRGAFEKVDGIEITGFSPPTGKCYDAPRSMKALKGDGIVFLTKKSAEVPDGSCCDDENCGCGCDAYKQQSIASAVNWPDSNDGSKKFYLAWQYGIGPVWIEGGGQGEKGEKGDQGIQGIQGIQGVKGDKGDQGDQGIQGVKGDTGDQGPAGDVGDITVTPTTANVDFSSLIFANLSGGQNVNTTADLNFLAASRKESAWTHIDGTATFTLDGANYDHVLIQANVTYEEGSPGGDTPIHPIFDLYRNGVIVASASAQNGWVSDESGQNSVKGSAHITFMDVGTLITGTTYKIRARAGNDNIAALTGVSGFFSAKAIGRTAVLTEIELSTP